MRPRDHGKSGPTRSFLSTGCIISTRYCLAVTIICAQVCSDVVNSLTSVYLYVRRELYFDSHLDDIALLRCAHCVGKLVEILITLLMLTRERDLTCLRIDTRENCVCIVKKFYRRYRTFCLCKNNFIHRFVQLYVSSLNSWVLSSQYIFI